MPASLPEYKPPHAQRAPVAVGVAPILALLALTLIVCGLIDADTGFAVLAACALVHLHQFQRSIDRYNEDYVDRHLAWRSPATLREAIATAPAPTRDFVGRFLQAEGALLRDSRLP